MGESTVWTPRDVSAVESAFATDVGSFMPKYEDIPRKDIPRRWFQFQRDWFFQGLKSVDGLRPKAGIDKAKALRHLAYIQRSFDPPHEWKEAGVAYLASLWFEDDSTWEASPPQEPR